MRDGLVAAEYQTKYGLQSRQWKLALKDALETRKYSDGQLTKGRRRNRLHALAKQRAKAGEQELSRNIWRCNLGHKKLTARNRRRKLELERQVNQALHEFHAAKAPAKIIHEDLSHLRGKAKSKGMSRLVSAWVRTTIKERLNFKAEQRGSLLVAVNSAYSSCVCPACGWVDKGNRSGDSFACRFCRYQTEADHAAALEIRRRDGDPDIALTLPKEQVKSVLLARFCRRLESAELPMSLSQLDWEAVRPVLGERVDAILKHLGVETSTTPIATVPGKTPGVASVAAAKPKRQGVHPRQTSRSRHKVEPRRVQANQPESETNFSPCPSQDFPNSDGYSPSKI